jgi:hypothetical protein
MSFFDKIRHYNELQLTPSKATFAPSLPSSKFFIFRVSIMQLVEFSNNLSGSAPSELILFLLIDSPVETFSFTSVVTSFRLMKSAEAP